MTTPMAADLSALCSNLGYSDGVRYYPDKDCYESCKDLMRYLRRDNASFEVRRILGLSQILVTDLLPLMDECHDVHDHFSIVLRLVVNLTNPPLLLYKEKVPIEKTARNHYLQQLSHLADYKKAFSNEKLKFWDIIRMKMSSILEIEAKEREEDQGVLLEHCLILLRNVLHVPMDSDADKRPENDASVHDELLWRLHTSGMKDLILFLASTTSEQQYYVHVLEIVSLMFREQTPQLLASAAVQRSVEERDRDETELIATRLAENREKMLKVQRAAGYRHSRFGGTFVVKNMKSISEEDQIAHKPLSKMDDALKFDADKKKRKTPKNRLPLKEVTCERRSAFSIRLIMKEFCVEFLNGAYNHLMSYVRGMIDHQSTQDNDESFYMWSMRFFMEFNRLYGFKVELVSETMNIATFHFVTMQLDKYQDMMKTDKPMIPQWSKRVHLAVRAYGELLQTLCTMDTDKKEEVRKSSSVIKSNVFYLAEYREAILSILLSYDERKFSRECLLHLIEAVHIFLKLLKRFSTKRSNLVVQTAQQKSKKTKKKMSKKSTVAASKSLEELWFDIGPELSAILQNKTELTGVYIPFDATSDVPIDDQKGDTMRKIQAHLRTNALEDAIGLLRASREVWPENDSFGSAHMAPEDELMAMHDIFMADIGAGLTVPQEEDPAPPEVSSEEEEQSDDGAQTANVNETSFEYKEFVFRFSHGTIIRAYGHALKLFATNSDYTNHCIASMFHSIAYSSHLPSLLFQTSLLITFEKIFESKNKRHKDLVQLGRYIVRNLQEVAAKNSKIWVELFFLKSRKDVDAIEGGDYTVRSKPSKSLKKIWSEEDEFELGRLYEEFQSDEDNRRDGGLIIFIMENIINKDRTEASVIKKLKELGYMATKARKMAREWTSEDDKRLTVYFEEHKDSADLATVLQNLTDLPRKQLVAKLLNLGLINNSRDLAKKKKPVKKNNANVTYTSKDTVDDDSTSSDDSDEELVTLNSETNLTWCEQATLIRESVKDCLRDVSGAPAVLEWLIKEMKDLADERCDNSGDDDDDIPDSPLFCDDDAITADANVDTFQKLFKRLGFEQGTFLVIPGKIVLTRLNNIIEVVEKAVKESSLESDVQESDSLHSTNSGRLVSENEIHPIDHHSNVERVKRNVAFGSDTKDSSESGVDSGFGEKKMDKGKVTFPNGEIGESDVDDNDDVTPTRDVRQRLNGRNKRRHVISSGSDASDDDEPSTVQPNANENDEGHRNRSENGKHNPVRKRVRIPSDDSASEDNDSSAAFLDVSTAKSSEVDHETKSQSENDRDLPTKKKKRIFLVESDDEDF